MAICWERMEFDCIGSISLLFFICLISSLQHKKPGLYEGCKETDYLSAREITFMNSEGAVAHTRAALTPACEKIFFISVTVTYN